MFQEDPVYVAVLAVLGLAVAGLLVAVIFLTRSLRASRDETQKKSKSMKPAPPEQARKDVRTKPLLSEPPVKLTTEEPTADDITHITPLSALRVTKPKPATAREDLTDVPHLSPPEHDEPTEDSGQSAVEESIARLLWDSEAEVDIEEPTGPNDIILVSAVGQTDRGVARRRNEDAYLIDTNIQLYAVADGMGGYAGGDVASHMAIKEVWDAMKTPSDVAAGYADCPRRGRELIAAVERANESVFQQSQTTRELKGMGTTIVAARFSPQKQRVYIAHVGDSRCYRFRRGELRMLTTDHTLASRGIVGPLGQNICRAIGVDKKVKVDLIVDKPLPEDIFLICSDGLPKMVTDEHIRRILTQHEGSLDRAAAQLVLAANAGGGRDNITVVIVRILEVTKTMRTATQLRAQKRVEFGPS